MRGKGFIGLGVLVLGGIVAGCSPKAARQEAAWPAPETVCILHPVISNDVTQAAMDVLAEFFPGAPVYSASRAEEAFKRCQKEGRVLLIPSSRYLPAEVWTPLQLYLGGGGAALLTGCDPFADRVTRREQGYLTEADFYAQWATNALSVEGFSNVQLWQHQNNAGALRGAVRVLRDADLRWPGVQVEVEGLEAWDAIVREPLPDLSGGENSLVFYARGAGATSQLIVECVEDDGARWFRRLPLSEAWRLHVLQEASFEYAFGAPNFGPGRRMKLSRVRKMSIGLFNHYAPQTPGRHWFALSDIRLAADPRPVEESVDWPDLYLISPPYRRYEFAAKTIRPPDGSASQAAASLRLQGPLPRFRGWGGEKAPAVRWIPVAEAVDAQNVPVGWPANLCVQVNAEGAVMRWGWMGLDLTEASMKPARKMLGECVRRLHEGLFLYQAGCRQMAFREGESLQVDARWTAERSVASVARVMAELVDSEGRVERRVMSPPSAYGEVVQVNLGRVPAIEKESQDYTLRVTLLDARIPDRLYDRLEQPVRFLAPPLADAGRIGIEGSSFTHGKRPLFLMGVNYWPVSVNGRAPSEPSGHWLDVAGFDPYLIRRDLDRLADVGVNAVSLQYLDEAQAPQLLYFLEEARRRNLWVHLFVDSLQPLYQDLSRARRLIEAAGLQHQSQVFAFDIAWEPHLGSYQDRCRFNADWARWLREQYGSEEHAEEVIGQPLWKISGQVTGPSDEDLSTDGEHRVAVAVYRRFVDDYMSRQYGHVKRFLRGLGCRQWISARSGYGGTGNSWGDRFFAIDPASGAAHLDFISPEGWGLQGDAGRFFEAGFITAYARGVSDGKPVLWTEFGCSVGPEPQPADLEHQARVYHQMLEMLFRSGAAGGLGWWFPGGYRVDERSDMGVVEPQGEWRPVGRVYQQVLHRLRQGSRTKDAWRGRMMDRDQDARGLSALWDRWREPYRQETEMSRVEEIRPVGFGQPTTEAPLNSVGGVPCAAPAPLQAVNAEWGALEIDGKPLTRSPGARASASVRQSLQLELINTGAAIWETSLERKPRTVWVRIAHALREPQYVPVERIGFGKSCTMAWTPSDPGLWKLRPWLWEIGGFGEELEIEVRNRRE